MEDFLHNMDWVLELRSPAATVVFSGFTWLGYTPFFLLFLPLGYWAWNKKVFTRLALFVLAAALLNAFLKDLWQDPRPDPMYALDGRVGTSYGMPSGHAQIGMLMWFWLAYELRRTWAFAAAAVIASGIVFSRLYLGVHDVEDVLVGSTLGLFCLLLCRWFTSPQFDWWRSLRPVAQVGVVLGLELLVFAVWPNESGPGRALNSGGFLAGWFVGAQIDGRYLDYRRSEQWWRIGMSAALGAAAIVALALLRREMSQGGASTPGLAAYSKAFFLGLFVTVLAPLGFRLLRLEGDRIGGDGPAEASR
jgi:glycerophosphoryl diester phosphodiesterase